MTKVARALDLLEQLRDEVELAMDERPRVKKLEDLLAQATELINEPLGAEAESVCPSCGGKTERVKEMAPVKWGEWPAVTVEHQFTHCHDCGEDFYESGDMDAVIFEALQILLRDHAVPRAEAEPVGRLFYEARTGGGHYPVPRYTHGMDAVIPACHIVVPLYTHPARVETDSPEDKS